MIPKAPDDEQNALALSAQLVKVRPPVHRSKHSAPPPGGETFTAEPVVLPTADDSVSDVVSGPDETATDDTAPPASASSLRTPNIVGVAPPSEPLELYVRNPNRYEILGEHGRGGLGRVMRARDKDLDRSVAIKELLRPSRTAEARFVREATITAKLQHPGIVPVHEAGRWPDGTPFYAMKLVAGKPLKQLISESTCWQERHALIGHVVALADAVAYAHANGVIHRDLKPSNVIVGEFGETVVIDWGLAKFISEGDAVDDEPYRSAEPGSVLTAIGGVVGTPGYMAPEQALGARVDQRADVYAIGAILYELLSGRRPRAELSAGGSATLPALQGGSRASLGEGTSEPVPEELAAIVERAMERRPEERYASARELAQELRQYQSGQLVSSYRYTLSQLLGRWLRRHKVAVAVATVAVILLATVTVVTVRQIVHEKAISEDARRREKRRADSLLIQQAESELERDATAAIAHLKELPPDSASLGRALEVAADARSRGVARYVLRGHRDRIIGLAFSGEAALTSVSSDGTVRQWTLGNPSPTIIATFPENSNIWLSPRGTWFLRQSLDDSRALVLQNLRTRELTQLESPIPGVDLSCHFSADEIHLSCFTWSLEGVTSRWNLRSRERTIVKGAGGAFAGLAPVLAYWNSPSEELVVTNVSNGETFSVDESSAGLPPEYWLLTPRGDSLFHARQTGELYVSRAGVTRKLPATARGVYEAVVSATGRWVAFAQSDYGESNVSMVVDTLAERRAQIPLRFLRDCWPVEFIEDEYLVVRCEAGQVRILGLDRFAVATFQTSVHRTQALPLVEVAQNGKRVAVAGVDYDISIWEPEVHVADLVPATEKAFFAANLGSHVALDHTEPQVRVVDLSSRTSENSFGHTSVIYGVFPSNSGNSFISTSWDNTARLWQRDGRLRTTFKGHKGIVRFAEFSPTEDLVATSSADGDVRLWRLDGSLVRVLRGHAGDVYGLSFSPDGRYLASGGKDRAVRIWDLTTGKARVLGLHNAAVYRVAFVGAGNELVTGDWLGEVRRWLISDDDVRSSVLHRHEGRVRALAVSKDRTRVASGAADGSVFGYDVESGARAFNLTTGAQVRSVRFDGDDTVLIADWSGTCRIWDFFGRHGVVLRLPAELHDAQFVNGREKLAVVAPELGLLLFDASGILASAVPGSYKPLQAWMAGATDAVLSQLTTNRETEERR